MEGDREIVVGSSITLACSLGLRVYYWRRKENIPRGWKSTSV